jgi:putative phage-type endonuclease
MTAIKVVNTKGMSREDWLQHRKAGIGGSDIAAILGFNAYRNAVSVWLEKTGAIDEVPEENFKMKMGHVLEPVVAGLFAEEYPEMKIRNNNYLLRSRKVPCMLANIDREVICPKRGKGVLEIKTTGDFNKKKWTDTNIPDDYMFQVQHYLAVTEYDFAYIAVLIGGNTEYKSYLIERDEGVIEFIQDEATKFWRMVEENEQPELDGSDASQDALKVMYKADNAVAESVDLPFELQAALEELKLIKAEEDKLKERKDLLQVLVKNEVGNYTMGRVGDWYVTWKPQIRNTVDSTLLKKQYPDVYAAVLKQIRGKAADY